VIGKVCAWLEIPPRLRRHCIHCASRVATPKSCGSSPCTATLELTRCGYWHGIPGDYVRAETAANPNTPAEVLSELATDTSTEVTALVADNPHTAAPVLDKLSSSADFATAINVSAHRNTSPHTLAAMATHHDGYVRTNIASHPNVTPCTLAVLTADRDSITASVAREQQRQRSLHAYAATLPEHSQAHAQLLISNGFPGQAMHLHRILHPTGGIHDGVQNTSARPARSLV